MPLIIFLYGMQHSCPLHNVRRRSALDRLEVCDADYPSPVPGNLLRFDILVNVTSTKMPDMYSLLTLKVRLLLCCHKSCHDCIEARHMWQGMKDVQLTACLDHRDSYRMLAQSGQTLSP